MLYDKDIREPLFEFLEDRFGKIRIIEEKRMGRSRADIVMVLEESVMGLEIKSDADTYARLSRQVRDYDRYCDGNYVVAGSTHGLHIGEHVPEWWGIITVEAQEGGPDFYVLREAAQNPNMDLKRKLGLLWRPELVHIQEINKLPRYKEKSKKFVVEKIIQKVPADVLARQISAELFERDYTTIEETIRAYREAEGKKCRKKRAKV
ncbi:MAG: sce7726 family protein [Enterocloster asparagiformis]|nr:sce7726 family protein [Enterocloster asparagiformis]